MKKSFLFAGILAATALPSFADTFWISTSSQLFSTAANWNNGLPSTNPVQTAVFTEQNGSAQTVQHLIDLAATARNSIGYRFDFFAGGSGFTLFTNSTTTGGLQPRAALSGSTILNNDDNTQTFNTSVQMFTNGGGSPSTAQTWSAAAGDMIFSGIYNLSPAKATVNNNGGTLTIDGAFNVTIGLAAGRGDITGAGGLIKDGAGVLTLGGTVANTYSGATTVNNGQLAANKVNALGTGALNVNGGTLFAAASQAVAAVTVAGGSLVGTAPITGSSYAFQSGTIDVELAGAAGLTKTTLGLGILGGAFGSANSYLGLTQIDAGILELGNNNRISDSSNMLLNGGTFSTAGFSETVGTLDLDISSTIDFGAGASTLAFADSDAKDWGASILSITNWTAGSDTLRFGLDGTGFDTQVALIRFTDLGNAPAQIDSSGFVTPQVAPEPSSIALVAFGLAGLAARRRRVAV